MKKFGFLVLTVLILTGCGGTTTSKKTAYSLQSSAVKMYDKKMLQGTWCDNKTDEAFFVINSGDIVYADGTEPYKYTFSNNILSIKIDGEISQSKVVFEGTDTLILMGIGADKGLNDTLRRCSSVPKSTVKLDVEMHNIKMLYGNWCNLKGKPSFRIDSDEVFYNTEKKAFKYTFLKNVLKVIYRPDYTEINNVVFKGNNMMILVGTGESEGINDTVRRCSN